MSAREIPARRCMGVIMSSDSRIEMRKSKLTPTLGNVGAAAAAGTEEADEREAIFPSSIWAHNLDHF
jgi:hypothetical protein